MVRREDKKLNMKVQWTKFIVVTLLYLAFLYWVKSWLGLIIVPFIYDAYISKKIRWQWWKDAEAPEKLINTALSIVNDESKLNELHQNILGMALKNSAERIAEEVLKIAKQ